MIPGVSVTAARVPVTVWVQVSAPKAEYALWKSL